MDCPPCDSQVPLVAMPTFGKVFDRGCKGGDGGDGGSEGLLASVQMTRFFEQLVPSP